MNPTIGEGDEQCRSCGWCFGLKFDNVMPGFWDGPCECIEREMNGEAEDLYVGDRGR